LKGFSCFLDQVFTLFGSHLDEGSVFQKGQVEIESFFREGIQPYQNAEAAVFGFRAIVAYDYNIVASRFLKRIDEIGIEEDVIEDGSGS
jgi:hypothetical protein